MRRQLEPAIVDDGAGGHVDMKLVRQRIEKGGPHGVWNLTPQLTRRFSPLTVSSSNVKLAEAERTRALVQYERIIQTAFTDVSNSLIAHQKVRESREKQEALVGALRDRLRLAYV